MAKKILALLLALLMITSVLFACNDESKSSESESDADNEINNGNNSGTPLSGFLLSGENAVRIVYADTARSSALEIAYKLNDATSTHNYNVLKDTDTPEDGKPEILVGLTNRKLSADAKNALKSTSDYAIMVSGKQIAIYAGTDKILEEAVKYFNSTLKVDADKQVVYPNLNNYIGTYTVENAIEMTIDNVAIDKFTIIIPQKYTNAELDFANKLSDYIMDVTGVSLLVDIDTAEQTANEILVGKTNRAQSTSISSTTFTSNYEFKTALSEGKLAIYADNAARYDYALKAFKSVVNNNKGDIKEAFAPNKFSLEQIKNIIAGAVYFESTSSAVKPHGFSKSQIDSYRSKYGSDHNYYNVSNSPIGVKLDFNTNSTSVICEYVGSVNASLFVNGEKVKNLSGSAHTITLDTSKKSTNRVTIYFDPNSNVQIKSVIFDSGATVSKPAYKQKLLIVGDSITYGWAPTDGVNGGAAYDQTWAQIISRTLDAETVIQGIGGTRFDDTIIDNNIKDTFYPDLIIVAFGYNDWAAGKNVSTTADTYIKALKAAFPTSEIVGISPINAAGSNYTNGEHPYSSSTLASLDSTRTAIEQVYKNNGCACIDGTLMVPVTGTGADRYKYFPGLNRDGVHPTTAGHAIYAQNLAAELKKLGVE